MNKLSSILKLALALSFVGTSGAVFAAYSSGSTGADGAFSPTTSQAIQLPPDGVFNYTSVLIPSGVTITYIKNAANTPVTILATTDVTIEGVINVSATPPISSSDISGAGLGGPGGYNGGRGGQPGGATSGWVNGYAGPNIGRAGIGPGAGAPGSAHIPSAHWGAGYADLGSGGGGAFGGTSAGSTTCGTTPGITYGNPTLIPMIGGSGGGGGVGGSILPGSGGGGGGGAILIAASGTINVIGSILANGGVPVNPGAATAHRGSYGGGGSGGAIRLIATTISGNGAISAAGGASPTEAWTSGTYGNYGVCSAYYGVTSQNGGAGRIRIEAENLARTTATSPAWSGGSPSLAFVPGLPTLKIESIGGVAVPANPSGIGDVALPAGFTNPVTVNFVTSGVTVGSSIKLTITPAQGVATTSTSSPTTGTTSSATTSVSVNLLSGPNTLQASVTYTVVASVGNAMSVYAQGERVEKVTLASTLGSKDSSVTLTTVSGKEFVVPAYVLAQFQS